MTSSEYIYCGPHRMQDELPESELKIGEALLSPTRTYLPVIKKISEEMEWNSKERFTVQVEARQSAFGLEQM